jgi:hypothetical protein
VSLSAGASASAGVQSTAAIELLAASNYLTGFTAGSAGLELLARGSSAPDVDITIFVGFTKKIGLSGSLLISPAGRVGTVSLGMTRGSTLDVGATHGSGLELVCASTRDSGHAVRKTRTGNAEVGATRYESIFIGDNRKTIEIGPTQRDRIE